MRILFTHSNKIASRIIRKLLDEPVSHCALEIGGTVVHSNFLGVHPENLQDFTNNCEIWGTIELPDDYQKMFELTCDGWGKRYDFGALLYLLARIICPLLPKKNLWQTSGMYLCSEWVSSYSLGEEDSMITPYQLFKKLELRNKKEPST